MKKTRFSEQQMVTILRAADMAPVAEGVSELRIDYGPRRGPKLTFLLAGGDKSTQRRDIDLPGDFRTN